MSESPRPEHGPHLAWRVRLFVASAVLALIGMVTGLRFPVWGAIGLLAVAFALRFRKASESEHSDMPDEPEG